MRRDTCRGRGAQVPHAEESTLVKAGRDRRFSLHPETQTTTAVTASDDAPTGRVHRRADGDDPNSTTTATAVSDGGTAGVARTRGRRGDLTGRVVGQRREVDSRGQKVGTSTRSRCPALHKAWPVAQSIPSRPTVLLARPPSAATKASAPSEEVQPVQPAVVSARLCGCSRPFTLAYPGS